MNPIRAAVAIAIAASMAACTDSSNTDGTDTDPASLSGDLVFTDANNYAYTADLTLDTFELAEGEDAMVDWSGLSADIQDRPIDPAAIQELSLAAFNLSKDEIREKVALNDLKQSDVLDYRLFENEAGVTDCMMSDFSILGNDFRPENEWVAREGKTWIITLWAETEFGRVDIRSSAFVDPVKGATGDLVDFTNTTANMDFTTDLQTSAPINTLTGQDSYTLDWSTVTTDSTFHDYDPLLGDQLLVGKVAASELSEVEDIFMQVMESAEELYLLDVYGLTDANLNDAETLDGTKFSGFTTDGIWLVGVGCNSCTSPAPLILSVVNVVE
jgi:hypothetical protein